MKLELVPIEDCDCISVVDEYNKEVLHIDLDYDMKDILNQITKLVNYINRKII